MQVDIHEMDKSKISMGYDTPKQFSTPISEERLVSTPSPPLLAASPSGQLRPEHQIAWKMHTKEGKSHSTSKTLDVIK